MEQVFKHRIEELCDRAYRTNQITATFFLDPAEAAQARIVLRSCASVSTLFSGGCQEAERMRIFFLPDYLEPAFFPYEEYFAAVHISCPFGSLSHRDYLGALMGLGIKREAFGDILVFNEYADVICTPQIAPYIIDNLTKAGRYGVKCSSRTLSDVKLPDPVFKTVSGTVASLRADSVLSVAFGISRTSAAELIKDGRLAVDHLDELSTSREIGAGALLSLRGYGRAKLSSIGGTSRKGRQFIELQVFSKN